MKWETAGSLNTYKVGLAAVFLALLSLALRWLALNHTAYANGWDAYFYLVQLKALVSEGQMHSRDLSLIYPLMLGLKWCGLSYVSTYKLSAALLAAFVSALCFLIGLKWSKNWTAALLVGCWSVFSPQLTYFAAQYPKNLLGLCILLLVILFVERPYWLIFLLIIGFFGHRLSALLAVGFALSYYLLKYRQWKLILFSLGGIVVVAVLGIALPGLFSLYDFERFTQVLQPIPHVAPLSFIRTMEQAGISFWWKAEILFCLALPGYALFVTFKTKSSTALLALLALLFLLIFPFLRWSVEGLAFRTVQVFILLVPLVLAFVRLRYDRLYLAFAALFLISSFFSWKSYSPPQHDAPYALYHAITQKAIKQLPVETELVIAHKSLAEYFTFNTSLDALPWLPEYEVENKKLYRLSWGFEPTELRYCSGDNKVLRLGFNYNLLPEASWQKCYTFWKEQHNAEALEKAQSWKNPYQERPAYLLKNKK